MEVHRVLPGAPARPGQGPGAAGAVRRGGGRPGRAGARGRAVLEHLLDELFYQLVRQQLLAWELEKSGAEGASRVRVVHVLPTGNVAYQQSLARPEHRALGGSVSEVWQRLLRRQERFVSMDSAMFLDAEITSREYVLRYAEEVIRNEAELLLAVRVHTVGDVENALYCQQEFDGEVELHATGIQLFLGRENLGLTTPLRSTSCVKSSAIWRTT